MNPDTPYFILYGIAAAALLVWLCGLQFLLRASRSALPPSEFWDDDENLPITSSDATIAGVAEVAGQPAELAAKAAAQLAQNGIGMLGQVRILEQTDERVAFEAQPHLAGRFLRRGVLDFRAIPGGRTQIDYAVLMPKRQGLLLGGWIFQILGLIALVAGFLAFYLWVAPHPNPAIRWQSIQMLHVFHFLWPPFLFAAVFRRVQTHARGSLDNLVSNLPYLKS